MTSARPCEYWLNRYAMKLEELKWSLARGRCREAYQQAEMSLEVLQCPRCMDDEAAVFDVIRASLSRWDRPEDPSHARLGQTLDARLSPPPKVPTKISISDLRFTHGEHSETFRHGAHARRTIGWLVQQLQDDKVSIEDQTMVLNVVFYHGEFCALNNRHAVALVRYSASVQARDPMSSMKCYVRVWPLKRGFQTEDGQDVVRKFLSAFSSSSAGSCITSRRPELSLHPGTTSVRDSVRVHVSNLDYGVDEEELARHVLRAGFPRPLVEINRRKNGKSNGYGWVTFESHESSHHLVSSTLPQLRGRELRLKLDEASAVQARVVVDQPSGGFVRCKKCRGACASLAETFLVHDVRQRRDGTPLGVFDAKPGYFCIAPEQQLQNCLMLPHPEKEIMSFKLASVVCAFCKEDLGNLQTTTTMEGNWLDLVGETVVNFRCKSVVLELTDCASNYVETNKWSVLAEAMGAKSQYRLGDLRMATFAHLLKAVVRHSGKDVRLVPV